MKKIVLTLGALLAVWGLAAQQDVKLLSFDEALVKTMTDNPEIQASRYQEKAAEQERKAAFGLRLPQIGITGTYAYMSDDIGIDANSLKPTVKGLIEGLAGSVPNLPPAILQQASALLGKNWGVTIQDRDFGFVGGNITLPVYTGGKINAANNAAKINERTVAKQSEQSRNALVSELVERYYGLALATQVVKVRQQVVDAVKLHLEDAIALEANGVIARSDRLYIEVKMAEAERELLAAQSQLETIHNALCNTLNDMQRFVPVSLMFVMKDMEDVGYFKDLALRNNPLLSQVTLKKELAQQNVKLQRSEFLPQVALMGNTFLYNYQVSKYLPTWTVGAGLKLNIFNGLNREYKYSAARNTVRQVGALEHKAQSDILVLIDKLYNEMKNYRDRMPSIDVSLEFADEYLRVKNAAFKEGMASSVDVIDAELNLASTRIEKVQTAYYYDLMLANLLEAAGVSEDFAVYAKSPEAIPVKYE